jgi:hypothetical protein
MILPHVMRSRVQDYPLSGKQLSVLPFLLVTLICQYTGISENNPQDAGDQVARHIESFLDNAHFEFLKDRNIPAFKSHHSAREIFLQMSERGQSLDASMLGGLFRDRA